MDVGIVNAHEIIALDDVESELRVAAEDSISNENYPDVTETMVD